MNMNINKTGSSLVAILDKVKVCHDKSARSIFDKDA